MRPCSCPVCLHVICYMYRTHARMGLAQVAAEDLDGYRVVFVFKDPAEALASRYDRDHCLHVQVMHLGWGGG